MGAHAQSQESREGWTKEPGLLRPRIPWSSDLTGSPEKECALLFKTPPPSPSFAPEAAISLLRTL